MRTTKTSGLNMGLRLKNPVFLLQVAMAIVLPILGYFGIRIEDITTFQKLGEVLFSAISNPYVLILIGTSLMNALNDPTSKGLLDSKKAKQYRELSE